MVVHIEILLQNNFYNTLSVDLSLTLKPFQLRSLFRLEYLLVKSFGVFVVYSLSWTVLAQCNLSN